MKKQNSQADDLLLFSCFREQIPRKMVKLSTMKHINYSLTNSVQIVCHMNWRNDRWYAWSCIDSKALRMFSHWFSNWVEIGTIRTLATGRLTLTSLTNSHHKCAISNPVSRRSKTIPFSCANHPSFLFMLEAKLTIRNTWIIFFFQLLSAIFLVRSPSHSCY